MNNHLPVAAPAAAGPVGLAVSELGPRALGAQGCSPLTGILELVSGGNLFRDKGFRLKVP